MTENTVITGDFVYSHANITYVSNLKTRFLVTINDFLEQTGIPTVSQSKISLASTLHSKPNILKTKKPEVFYKFISY